ncbi:MAG: Qat anti-phage system QueC-like protein QatC [Thermodesulfobacteriota bacterium]
MAAQLYLKIPGEKRRPPPGIEAVIHLDEPDQSGYPLHQNLSRLFNFPAPPGQAVQAFLILALGVWAADKFQPRRTTLDAWTRQLTLHLPTNSQWLPLAPRLAQLLNFLTGDNWTLKLREASLDLGLKGEWLHSWAPDAVMLFSGGLDSLVGALDFLEAGQRLLLVSHYDFGQLASIQQNLAAALVRHFGVDRLHHLGIRVQFPEAPELTMRSRSLLYLALGLIAAATFASGTPLIIPENGWISLNPPLTGNRLGSYSTRTTHPYFLEQLTNLWQEANCATPLVNPYQELTKGEMLNRCRNHELLEQLFRMSVSCARPVVSRWQGGSAGSCGYCYPCLMRRAALHSLGWDRGEDYLRDVLAAPEILAHRVRGGDLRALLLALKTWEDAPEEVEARFMLGGPPETLAARFSHARQVLNRGFQEIAGWLLDKGPKWVQAYMA